jgi:hypothetical protein
MEKQEAASKLPQNFSIPIVRLQITSGLSGDLITNCDGGKGLSVVDSIEMERGIFVACSYGLIEIPSGVRRQASDVRI